MRCGQLSWGQGSGFLRFPYSTTPSAFLSHLSPAAFCSHHRTSGKSKILVCGHMQWAQWSAQPRVPSPSPHGFLPPLPSHALYLLFLRIFT